MDLYLIRHADALPLGEQGVRDDADRPLSPTGHVQVRALAATLYRLQVRLDKIVSSPLLRARQTAEGLVHGGKTVAPEVVLSDDLAFGGKRRRLARFLGELGCDSVALVGHQPDMSELAGWLVGSRAAQIEFAKAGAAYIECDEQPGKGCGTLIWLTTPDWYSESQ